MANLTIKEVDVEINDTVNSLYSRFLFPEGVKGMVEAVNLIHAGDPPRVGKRLSAVY